MTTTVNRVYVDAEGVVRMSPTGWPEEQNYADYEAGVFDQISLHAAEEKAKEESIPFEDQSAIIKRLLHYRDLPPGFYTIEPIQVELRYFFTIEITVEGIPNMKGITQTEYQRLKETLSESQFKRDVKVVARIVTEEEKPQPAPVVDKPVQTISVPISLIPKGAKLVEAYETERSITVMFCPGEEVPENHNCDEMGCGSFSHVKYRLSLPEPPKP